MSYLTIGKGVAKNVGLEAPGTMMGSDADAQKIGQFINEAGQEIARRVDWKALRKRVTIAGTGDNDVQEIGADFSRLTRGMNVVSNGEPVRGSLSTDEWLGLPEVEGDPRYYFLDGRSIAFFPFMALGNTATVQYQSKNWVGGSGDAFTVDTQVALFSERLIELGAVWRWRRAAGKDYADHMAEFEASLADLAQFDGGIRQP